MEIPPTTRSVKRLLNAAAEIATDPITAEQDKAFLTRQLVQVTLPHSSPGNVPIWKRTNGNLTLSIRPGWCHQSDQSLGLPFGCIPRLLLFWITTEALRNKSRKIQLGDSLSGFMRDLGMNPDTGGGKRSDAKRLRAQMERLFRATISLDIDPGIQSTGGKKWLDMQIAPKGELWWDFQSPEQADLFGSWIELGEQFYDAVITAPVPLDKRALNALKRSPMALDLYSWATYKTFVLSQGSKKEQFIPWRAFIAQMGANYTDIKNFKRKTKEAFRKVQAVYPSLKIEDADAGFIIKASRPAVPIRASKRIS